MAHYRLELAEEARLYRDERPVRLRRRGLAILSLIALGFRGNRAELAGMLWEHGSALNNLRVELSALRRHFPGWAWGEDPLPLPEGLEVRASPRPLLANLRGLTPALDAWLKRLDAPEEPAAMCVRLPPLRPPFILFVRRLPLADASALAEEVARASGLSRTGPSRGLGVMEVGQNFSIEDILRHPNRSWLVILPPYGEDPVGLLELRARLPADRIRYTEISPLSWREARESMLAGIPYREAAHIYLASGGQPGHIAELLALRPPGGFGRRLRMPQRVRAVYQWESRFLTLEARMALERLSVQPGLITRELLAELGLDPYVEELERKRWLVFHDGWRFRHEAGRRVLAASLEEGRRRRYHRQMSEAFERLGQPFAAAYHAWQAGLPWVGELPQAGWVRAVLAGEGEAYLPVEVPLGRELLIEGLVPEGNVEVWANRAAFVRTPSDPSPTRLHFEAPDVPALLRLEGHAYLRNALRVGLEGNAIPLVLEGEGNRILMAPVDRPTWIDGDRVLPIAGHFVHWVLLVPGQNVTLASWAEAAVIEVSLEFYRVGQVGARQRVPAYALDARMHLDAFGEQSA